MKSAVCVVIPFDAFPNPVTSVLAVSRRHNTTQWGFPGGKVDPGETNIEAVTRELCEEVGIVLDAEYLVPVYSGLCPGNGPADTYWVTTYYWTGPVPDMMEVTAEEGLLVKPMCRNSLCDSRNSPFSRYNQEVYFALDKYLHQAQVANNDLSEG